MANTCASCTKRRVVCSCRKKGLQNVVLKPSVLLVSLCREALIPLYQELYLQLTRALRTPSANAEHKLSTPSTAWSGVVALAI
ncbi:hypothetical protein EMIT0194P_10645 [Pseudomonas serbica]